MVLFGIKPIGIKPINTLSGSSFYRKIMQKSQAGKKNTSRFPTMFFYKGKGSVFPQKINMTLKFSFHLNQQNIVPLLILKNIPDIERTLSRLSTEKKVLQSVLKLKDAQSTDPVTKILLSFLAAFKATQGCSAVSGHLLNGNFSINKTSVFSSLKSLIFMAENIISNLSKITKISLLPSFNASSQQKTLKISPELLTLNSRIFPGNSKVLNYEIKTEILNSCFFASKSNYMRLDTSRKPIFVDKENVLNYLSVLEDKLPSNYLRKQTLIPSLVVKNTNVIKKILSRLNIEKSSLQSVMEPENAQNRNNVANISQAVFGVLRRFKVSSGISSGSPSNEYIFADNTPVFSSLKLLSSRSGNRVNYPENILKLLFLPISNTFYQRNFLTISPDVLTLNSVTFPVNSKTLNYKNTADILNSQISRTEKGYTLLNLVKKFVFTDNESAFNYLPVLKDKLSSSYLRKQAFKPSFILKNVNIVEEIFSRSGPEKNGLQVISKPIDARNKNDIVNIIQALSRVSQEYSISPGYFLAGNTSGNQVTAFSYLRSLISRSVNLTNTLNKITKPSFLSVNNASFSQKKSTVFSDILALNPKIGNGHELFISSEKAFMITVFKKYTERFLHFRLSTTHTEGIKILNYENNLEILNSQTFGENIYSRLLNFAKNLTFIYKENKSGYWSVFENKFSSSYPGKQNISSILTVKNLPFIKEIFSWLNTEKISMQKLLKPVDAQKKGEAVNMSQAVLKIPGIYPIGPGILPAGNIFTNRTSIFLFPSPAHELFIDSENANIFTVFKKYIERFFHFRFMTTHPLTHTQTQTHNLFLKSLIFKSDDNVINLNRILKPTYLPENPIHYKPATLSTDPVATEFSSPTFSYNNRKTLNSQVFKVNKNFGSLNAAKDTDFITINITVKNQLNTVKNQLSTVKNQLNTVKNQFISGTKLDSVILQDNLSFNKIYGINKRFFKVSNRITVNKPFVKDSYVHFEHEPPDHILSKYNYNMRDENLVFQDQRHIEQEIEKIKKTLIETRQSISEKKVPVFGEADIKKYIDINRISSQVYQNLERTIRMERERRGM